MNLKLCLHRLSVAMLLAVLPIVISASARADALVVALDVSESSPIFGDDAFLRSAAAQIADRIRALPVGSKVRVFYLGDDRVRMQMQLDLNVQRLNTREGATAEAIAKAFPAALVDKVAEFKLKPMHRQSHLTTGFFDGVRLCTDHQSQKEGGARAERCEIFMLSDGAQYEKGRIEYPRDVSRRPLPPVAGLDLRGVRVTLFGCGQGLDSAVRVTMTARWENWLRDAGATEITLRRL